MSLDREGVKVYRLERVSRRKALWFCLNEIRFRSLGWETEMGGLYVFGPFSHLFIAHMWLSVHSPQLELRRGPLI